MEEHELDHILIGSYNDDPILNKEEASDFKWMKLEDIKEDLESNPMNYTSWFKIIIQEQYEQLTQLQNTL